MFRLVLLVINLLEHYYLIGQIMKGKKLNDLLKNISKSNKHNIINKCKASNDKRYKELYKLMINYSQSGRQFEKLLDNIGENISKSNNDDKNKIIRRFVDFAVTLIEDVLLHEHLSKNYPLRNSLLVDIFKEKNEASLQEKYLRKLHNYKIETLNYNIQEQYYNDNIAITSRSQKHNDTQKWWEFIGEKYKLTNKIYFEKITEIYELGSTAYLVDKQFGTELLTNLMDDKHLNLLAKTVDDSKQALEIKIAEVKFSFENKSKAFELLKEIKNDVKKLSFKDDYEKDTTIRKVHFISFLLNFNYNDSQQQIIKDNNQLLNLSKKHNRPDSLNNFYRLFLQLINNPTIEIIDMIENVKHFFTLHNDEFLLDFIMLYHSFLNKDYKKALTYVNEQSYAPNPYIRIWAKQIELLIHYRKGNFDLCDILLERALRQMKLMQTKPYTLASSAMFFKEFHNSINTKIPKLYKELSENFTSYSIFHEQLITELKK